MENEFQYKDESLDKMSHEAILISTDIRFDATIIEGKKDKRFKSGWRIKPSTDKKITLTFVVERDKRHAHRQFWRMGKDGIFGTYVVVSVGAAEIKLLSVSVGQVSLQNITIGKKIDMIYYGNMFVGEGSKF